MLTTDLFTFNVPSGELFGTASNINSYYVQAPNSNDKVAYWTKNTVIPSGNIYFNTGITTGVTWLKISDKNLETSNTTIYGVPANGVLTGSINYYMENCQFKNIAIGGPATAKIMNGDLNVTFKNCSCTATGIMGFNISDNINVKCNIINSTCTGTNGWLISALYRNNHTVKSEINTMDIHIKDCVFNKDKNAYIGVFANSSKSANQPSDTNYCHIKEINIVLDNCYKQGTFSVDNQYHPIYCGGYAADTYNANDKTTLYIDNINVKINSGRYHYIAEGETVEYDNGRAIYLGTWSNNKGKTVIGNINCEINGGEFFYLLCGPATQGDGVGIVTGDTHVYINGGKFNGIGGMGGISTGSGSQHIITSGTIYIHLNGGEPNAIYPGMRHGAHNTVTGDGREYCQNSYIIVSGNNNFTDTYFRGCVMHNDDAFRQSNLIFDNYTGNIISGSIIGFENIEIKDNSSVTLTDVRLHNNNPWVLDLTHRSIDNSEDPLLSFTCDYDLDFNIELKIKLNDNNTLSSFKLITLLNHDIPGYICDGGYEQINTNISIYYNDQFLTNLDINDVINDASQHFVIENTGTIFDGYYLALSGEYSLMFCKP